MARPEAPRARLFVALDVAEPARAELAAWRDGIVAGREDLRPVAAQALHLTLVFLGWQEEADAERIGALVRGAVGAPPRLVPSAVTAVPPRGTRLFALDLEDEDGRAETMQASLSAALEREGLYRPEKRPFWPHVTLARVKKGARARPLEAGELPPAFAADRLTLYRSTLRPAGAIYQPLAAFDLE